MPIPNVHPLVLDELIVLLSNVIMNTFTPDEQALIGTFLASLGSITSFNSVYLLYTQGLQEAAKQKENKEESMEVLKKCVDTLQKEMATYKENSK